jgi:hypothetical protein
LIGAISRKLGCIKAFLIILILHLLASMGTGIYAIRLVFQQKSEYVEQCVGTSVDPDMTKNCKSSFTLLKVFVVAVYAGAWLIEICTSV